MFVVRLPHLMTGRMREARFNSRRISPLIVVIMSVAMSSNDYIPLIVACYAAKLSCVEF